MPSFRQRLGGFGRRVIERARDLGRTIGETVGLLERHEIEIEPEAATRDWGKVRVEDALSPEVQELSPWESVPHDLYSESEIPWKQPYAYQVAVYGRDRETGRFASSVFDMTVSREMTIEEIQDTARFKFGGYEESKMSEIFDVAVTGAYRSPDVVW